MSFWTDYIYMKNTEFDPVKEESEGRAQRVVWTTKALNKALADEKTNAAVGSLIAYNSSDGSQEIGLESLDITYTSCVLERLGFSWPETGRDYIRRFLEKLNEKGFF